MRHFAAFACLLVGLLLPSALTGPVDFTRCEVDGGGEQLFNVTEIILEPEEPKAGEAVEIIFRGVYNGDANVTAGEILFTVTDVPFIGEFEADFDVCKLVDCPLASGEFELGTKQELPAITPAKEYGFILVGIDKSEGREERTLMCLEGSITVREGEGGPSILDVLFG